MPSNAPIPGLIAEIEKNAVEVIRVSWSEYKGHHFLDVRVYYEDGETGEWKPTKKGIAIAPDLLPELIAALQTAEGTKA